VMQLTSRCMLVPGARRSGISTQAKRNNLACLSTSRSFGSKSSCPSKGWTPAGRRLHARH
jgi:hypothetical protein